MTPRPAWEANVQPLRHKACSSGAIANSFYNELMLKKKKRKKIQMCLSEESINHKLCFPRTLEQQLLKKSAESALVLPLPWAQISAPLSILHIPYMDATMEANYFLC